MSGDWLHRPPIRSLLVRLPLAAGRQLHFVLRRPQTKVRLWLICHSRITAF